MCMNYKFAILTHFLHIVALYVYLGLKVYIVYPGSFLLVHIIIDSNKINVTQAIYLWIDILSQFSGDILQYHFIFS